MAFPEGSQPLPVARTANVTMTGYISSRGERQIYMQLHTPSGGPHDPEALRALIGDVERQLEESIHE